MVEFLQLANWSERQHYKRRSPPWIKAYANRLDDYAFISLPDAAKAHLSGLELLASRCDNRLPRDPKWLAEKIGATEPIDLDVLVAHGFLEPAQTLNKASTMVLASGEKRREEKRRERRTSPAPKPLGAPRPPAARRGGAPEPIQQSITLLTLETRAAPGEETGPGSKEWQETKARLRPPQAADA